MRITPTDTPGRREQVWGGATNAFGIDIYEARVVYAEQVGGSSTYPTTALDEGVENFLAIVRNGTSIKFYINGETVEEETLSATFLWGSLVIGDDPEDISAPFTGTLSNFCYFSDAKSDSYIAAFYNSGSYTDYEDGDPA